MRKPREESLKIDMTKPIKIEPLDDDCLGKEWLPHAMECKLCADSDVCCTLFARKKEQVVKKKEEVSETYFLDMANFEAVPVDKLVAQIKKLHAKGTPASLTELEYTIQDIAQCSDDLAVKEYMRRIVTLHNLTNYVTE